MYILLTGMVSTLPFKEIGITHLPTMLNQVVSLMLTSPFFYPPFAWLLVSNLIMSFANEAVNHKEKLVKGLILALIVSGIFYQSPPTNPCVQHTFIHLAFATLARIFLLILWTYTFRSLPPNIFPGLEMLLSSVCMYIVGFLIAPFLTYTYFYICVLNFNVHYNEGISNLEIQDFKGFLRFKVTAESLEVYALGIDKVPSKWRETDVEERSKDQPGVFAPVGGDVQVHLIEKVEILK